jgi:hypothetical protein
MFDKDIIKKEKKKTSREELDKMMKEFLAKGGKIEKLKPGIAREIGYLDKAKVPRLTKQEIESGKSRGDYVPEEVYQKEGTHADMNLEDKIPVYEPTNREGR